MISALVMTEGARTTVGLPNPLPAPTAMEVFESLRLPPMNRFWSKVNQDGPVHPVLGTACWLWVGALNSKGYGCFGFEGHVVLAHRMAWFLAAKKWPEPMALHQCDNRPCVRFDHLFEGDQQDNVDDRGQKGRSACGTKVNSASLSPDDVLAARQLFAEGGVTKAELAKYFGVGRTTMRYLLIGRTWKSVSECSNHFTCPTETSSESTFRPSLGAGAESSPPLGKLRGGRA
jgi:hypothetical protein